MAAQDTAVADLAAALVDGRETATTLFALNTEKREALAWALKEQCHAAWSVDPARAVRAADVLAQLAGCTGERSEGRALMCWTAGLAALVQGQAEHALAQFDAAAAVFDALGDGLHAAQTQVPKLIALSLLGRNLEAVDCGQHIRERFIVLGDRRSAGKVELNLASMLLRQDRHTEARELYRAAAARFAQIGDTEHSVMADIGLGTTLTWLFDFAEAQRIHERACHRAAMHGFPVLEALARGSLGQLELYRGRHALALKHTQAGFERLRERGDPQRRLDAQRMLADVYLAVGLLPEAMENFDAVAATSRTLKAPLEHAWAEIRRAQTLALMGRLEVAGEALATARRSFSTASNAVGLALADLLDARLALRDARAAHALDRASAASAVLGQAGIVSWTVEAELVAADALLALGDVVTARQRIEAAHAQSAGLPEAATCDLALARLDEADGRLDSARKGIERAAAHFERARSALPVEDMRIAFAGDKEACFDALVRLAPRNDGPALLCAMERSRARALADALRRGGEALALPDDQRSRLNWLHQQWMAALAAGPAGATQAAAIRHRLLAEEKRCIAAARSARIADSAATEPSAERRFQAQALLQALDQGTAFVEYHVEGDHWTACVAAGRRVQVVQGEVPRLSQRLQELRFQLEAPRAAAAATLQRHLPQLLQRVKQHLAALYRDLFAPLEPALDGVERVVIAPHRGLHHVPFAALQRGAEALIGRFELSMAPSATVWMSQRRPGEPANGGTALLLGYGGDLLPQVRAEVEAIAGVLQRGGTGSVRVLLDDGATLSALQSQAPGARIVHLACHAQARADNPAFSALHLADGVFTLADAAALRWQADLVVLSACETAISRIAPGDEVQGLSRGFLAAGVPAVVASLWSVADGATAVLMKHFYAALAQGSRPAAALRAAQQALAAEQPHPFHWAAFSVHGRG